MRPDHFHPHIPGRQSRLNRTESRPVPVRNLVLVFSLVLAEEEAKAYHATTTTTQPMANIANSAQLWAYYI